MRWTQRCSEQLGVTFRWYIVAFTPLISLQKQKIVNRGDLGRFQPVKQRPRGRAAILWSCITVQMSVYISIYQLFCACSFTVNQLTDLVTQGPAKASLSCVKLIASNRLMSGIFTTLGCSQTWRSVTMSTQHWIRPVRGISDGMNIRRPITALRSKWEGCSHSDTWR